MATFTKDQLTELENKFSEEQLQVVTRNAEGQVEVNPEIFAAQIQKGWKKDKLAKHYDLPATQIAGILTHLGLKIRKFHKPSFVIVSATEVEETAEVQQENTDETADEVEYQENENTEEVVEDIVNFEKHEEEQVSEQEDVEMESKAEEVVTPTRASWNN